MESYKQVVNTAELALIKGEYSFCIEYLNPIINSYPPSTEEGVNLRTIIITALSGINKKEEAKIFCKQLLKSHDYKVRENAKYLMEIIDSPEIKKPENWNITIENNPALNKTSLNSLKAKKINIEKKKFINTSNIPTGETKPFKRGFVFVIFFLILLLIPLLSGCVKIENTLDLSEIDSISNYLKVESRYIKKLPWQQSFEEKIKNLIPDSEILIEELNFSLKNNNLKFNEAKDILYKIQKTAGDFAVGSTDLEINRIEKNFFLLKKLTYTIDFDLQNLSSFNDLELHFNIINPNKVILKTNNNSQIEIFKNIINWTLIPGEINSLEFSYWNWNKLFIGLFLISLILSIAYLIKYYRYQMGSDLPELPSN